MPRINDLGGMHGFGAVDPHDDPDVPFDRDWEMQIYGLHRAMLAKKVYNSAEFRHARERLEPAQYLSASYYERTFLAIRMLLIEKGLISASDVPVGEDA